MMHRRYLLDGLVIVPTKTDDMSEAEYQSCLDRACAAWDRIRSNLKEEVLRECDARGIPRDKVVFTDLHDELIVTTNDERIRKTVAD